MGRTTKVQKERLVVAVDVCRVRLQTGRPVVFVDARKPDDWRAKQLKITGAVRLKRDADSHCLPYTKHDYIVVYCA
jgi:hypothetical protein